MTPPVLMLGMPVHGQVDARVMLSLAQTSAYLTAHGIRWAMHCTMQEASVSRARNHTVAAFLRSGAERLLFIDSDMVWTPEDVAAILATDEDIVASAYAKKLPGTPDLVGRRLPGGEERGPLVECDRLGTGFMLMGRAGIDRMISAYPETAYVPEAGTDAGTTVYALFHEATHAGQFYGEDWNYSRLWRDIGGRLWMHTGIKPGHVGTHVYTMNPA